MYKYIIFFFFNRHFKKKKKNQDFIDRGREKEWILNFEHNRIHNGTEGEKEM